MERVKPFIKFEPEKVSQEVSQSDSVLISKHLELLAERGGFEPPIPLQVCLISSQVHSTGLCHLSVL
jgi:hypothetical protein